MASSSSLHAVADENIPFAQAALGTLADVQHLPGRDIQPAAVRETDVLWVRSVTPVGQALLEEAARLRFVGSATAGTDHVDRAALAERGIAFAHAPGSNASSVADYVVAALLAVAVRQDEAGGGKQGAALRGKTAAVVGCGAVGSRVARRLEALGLQVLRNDPPLAEAAEQSGNAHDFVPLGDALSEADLVTLHTPLTRDGAHPTFHLVDAEALAALRPGAWLVNTSRGEVVDGAALRADCESGRLATAVLDVWPGEPMPAPALVQQAAVATPHIAGYAFDGKVRGTEMLYQALCARLGTMPRWHAEDVLAAEGDAFRLAAPDASLPEAAWLDALVRQMYDVRADDARLRDALNTAGSQETERGAAFARLRRDYPRRRAFSRYRVDAGAVPPRWDAAVEDGLGVRMT